MMTVASSRGFTSSLRASASKITITNRSPAMILTPTLDSTGRKCLGPKIRIPRQRLDAVLDALGALLRRVSGDPAHLEQPLAVEFDRRRRRHFGFQLGGGRFARALLGRNRRESGGGQRRSQQQGS